MENQLTVYLDDGGVMNDNQRRGAQWRRLVAEFFSPILGGDPVAWSEANWIVANRILAPVSWHRRLDAATDYARFDRDYQLDWLGGMCDLVGVPAPPAEESVALAHQATLYVTRRVRAAFPGVVEAIRALHARGYPLHTASGESSVDLTGYLDGMGVLGCFDRLYGPDLIGVLKGGPAFYERLLADSGVAAREAVFVDDSPQAIGWAASVGARTVLVSASPPADTPATIVISRLAELPEVLERLGNEG